MKTGGVERKNEKYRFVELACIGVEKMRVETKELGIVFEIRFKRDSNMPRNSPDLGAVKWFSGFV